MKSLVESRSIPLSNYVEVTELARRRLMDRLPNVRKNVIQLLVALICHNPYGGLVSRQYTVHA